MSEKKKILAVSRETKLLGILKGALDVLYDFHHIYHTDKRLDDMIIEQKPDIIIMDALMPDMRGMEVSVRIRLWYHCPILILTTWDVEEEAVKTIDLTRKGLLSEPLYVPQLQKNIEKILLQ